MTAPLAGALEACLALLGKATPGEWRWSPNGNIVPAHYTDDCEIAAVYTEHSDDSEPANAAAIISAVNLLRDHGPALLAALRMREWRPIAEAPKGSRKVVALISNNGPRGYVTDPWTGWIEQSGRVARWPHYFPPTHFCELPAAPPTADNLARVLEEGE